MCVLLAAAEGEVAPRDVLEHVRRGSSRPPYPAVTGPVGVARGSQTSSDAKQLVVDPTAARKPKK